MQVTIVPFYAALLSIFYIFLSVNVLRIRGKQKIAIGDGGNVGLQRAIRIHANFAEYVPIALILITFVEIRQASPIIVHALCLILIIGRLIHSYGVSQINEDLRFRVVGMAMTFSSIIAPSALILGISIWK